ncbi:MAG: hypothetical protein KDA49_16820 [Rhodospirillaceae bacterium]|nr:hypothetical protein [Rhodospirillaceae bacterium]
MPLEHIHPMIVHFPIVLALVALAFDLWSITRRGGSADTPPVVQLRTGTVLFVLGAVAAVVTYLFGDMAYDIALDRGVPEATLEPHEGWGTITMITFLVVALLRVVVWWRGLDRKPMGTALAVVPTAAVAVMVVVTAYFGGHLVYDVGVNVASLT